MKGDDSTANILNAISHLVEVLVASFGALGTCLLIFAIIAIGFLYLYWQYRKKNKDADELIKEKDRTIQRLANMERELRAMLFCQMSGWSEEKVERIMIRNDFDDAASAREVLEKSKTRPLLVEKKQEG